MVKIWIAYLQNMAKYGGWSTQEASFELGGFGFAKQMRLFSLQHKDILSSFSPPFYV